MTKNIHIFGDSYSAGYGFNRDVGRVPSIYSPYSNCSWDQKINLFLKDYKVINYAIPGSSNEVSKDSLLQNINSIEKGDIIIYNLTDYYRLSILANENHHHKIGKYFHFTSAGYLSYLQDNREKEPLEQLSIPYYLTLDLDKLNISYDSFTSLVGFYEAFIDDERFAKEKEEYFEKTLNGLISFFSKLDVQMYVWDSTLRGDGETINQWSNGEYNDLHWSPNGHNYFLGFILWAIENNKRNLNFNTLRVHRKNIDEYTKSIGLNNYIKHDPLDIPIK